MTLKRNMLRSLLALSALMLVGPAAAQASTDSYSCTVDGATGSLTPAIKDIPSDAADTGGLLDTEPGEYTFNGGGTCTKNAGVPYDVSIESAGVYANVVCGTGTATADVLANTKVVGNGETVNATYHINFREGVGDLTVTHAVSSTHGHSGPTGSGIGVIDIVPDPADGSSCTASGGVKTFLVNGSFTADIHSSS